ncbi:partner and localizer of BRCA2 isoform X2 [Archocentrus centrarchus]|uniref:partner and localizer of BRCA2 isoform X2 n=1 Tax=Archocentrus centrarchus TaxID=63155 RepID=UPI0011EA38AB|nr:partner and localizer of BRCA2 isoform X2 [Archocentrus centrarchus]
MESTVGDILHCEERLRSTLHCDDKEKLRRKLAELQREYLKTAQRLQRAERSEAVRRHVRNRITEQNHQDQRGTEAASDLRLNPSSLTLNSSSDAAQGLPQCQGHTEGPADSDNSRRTQVIRFLLPSDAACPQMPDPSHAAPTGHRPSSSLRLRSRRSRLRWECRSAETGKCEKGQKQSEGMERAGEEEKLKSEGGDAMNEREEFFSGTDSESPSLLLTHWSAHGCTTETRDIQGKDIPGSQEQNEKYTVSKHEGEKESESLLVMPYNPTIQTEESGQEDTQNGRRKEVEKGEVGENSRGHTEDTEQNVVEKTEGKHSHDNSVELKGEKNGFTGDGKSVSLLDSCTLVEGLLFPVEYYVRTTRRMTLSQSQPDVQAVIASQLSRGRHRRSRGRGRGQNRNTHTSEHSEQRSQTNFSSLRTASADSNKPSQTVGVSAEHSQSSGEISDHISACRIDTSFSPTVTTVRPARGRRRKRGVGRGRSQMPRASLSLNVHQSAGDPKPTSTPISSWQSAQGADGPEPCLIPEETDPSTDEPHHVSSHITDPPVSSGVNGAPSSSASGHPKEVCQIFMKKNTEANGSPQNRSTSSWRSLLLPSSSPAQTSLLPLPSLLSGRLTNLDTHQDFHLPDDQFASLKLLKLRQVTREAAVEPFSSPSYNTRSSWRRTDFQCSSDPAMPLPLPLSLTPTIVNSPHHNEEQLTAAHSTDIHNLSTERKLTDTVISPSFTEEQQTENVFAEPHSISTEPKSVVQKCADDCVDEEHETVTLNSSVQPQTHMNSAERTVSTENDHVIDHPDKLEVKYPAPEKQTHLCSVAHPSEPLSCINHQAEDKVITETVFFESTLQEAPSSSCTVLQACNDVEPPGESPVKLVTVPSSPTDSNKTSEPNADLSPNRLTENQPKCSHSVSSQLILSSPLASVPCSFITPHQPSSTLTTSPKLPSLGLTPHPVTCSLTSSPCAPFLTLPPPHSPSTHDLSPPALSPSHSITYLPPILPPLSPSGQIQASAEPPLKASQHHTVESATPLTPSNRPLEDSAGEFGLKTEEMTEELVIGHMQTLKAAAGGILVDVCCFPGSSGGLCVAAAGKWAVCLWSQASASEWKLTHTWTFSEPVINVFPVLDAAGLICVTLGQLEIREVRTLSCSSLMQMLLCEGVLQAAIGVSESRVVTTSHSATGSTLQVFMLSDYSSPSCQPLESPGVCVGALAPVDGLADALIGTDEGGHLFVWNLKTGQLLCRVLLGEGFSHTACLRGYSSCGVLFVLLQHQFLNSLEEEEKEGRIKDHKTALFSLVAINPLSGKSIPATQLYPPESWTGRLCEADISGSSVVGLSQNGCACVWELGRPGASKMVWAPESDGWQLARWGGRDTLVTGHHNGDVTLHCYSQTALLLKTDSQMAF